MFFNTKTEKGFTLVEMLISVSIFIVIVTMAMGSLVVIFQSNRQTASIRLALDNANFALNAMSRDIRLSKKFTCGGGDGVCDGDDEISFPFFSKTITYKKVGGIITKQVDTTSGDGPALPLTSDRYDISELRFVQSGTVPDFITIYMKGTATTGDLSTDFDLQTGISSRHLIK
jgi:type II secretory pathway pseudopilin PulG